MTDNEKKLLFGFGLLAAGVFLFMKRRSISSLASQALDVVNAGIFLSSIPVEAEPYSDIIRQVAQEESIDPFVLTALGYRESRWGAALSPPDPSGTGDAGHGRGLMQIDDRTWGDWLASNDWTDPLTNVRKGAQIYGANISYFQGKGLDGDALTQAALAAYNHGPGNVWKNIQAGLSPDTGTASGNYASSVWGNATAWSESFASSLGGGNVA